MSAPDFLPTLSAGAHDSDAGEACVMEYVSLLAGEEWSDRPECTHPLLAHEARTTNDLLLDSDRPRLVPLIGRLFGTTEDSPELRARLRLTQARRVVALIEPSAKARAMAAIEHAEAVLAHGLGAELDDPLSATDLFAMAMHFPAAEGELDAEHRDMHLGASKVFAFSSSPELRAPEAHAIYALVVAHRIAMGECRADCGNGPARARRMVKDLEAMVDTYDEVTGRQAGKLDVAEVRQLIAEVS